MKRKTGFTIIEVVLVLTVAVIIFLMAFLAFPSLQASQRDAERKANVMEFISALKNYQTNNSRGALPIVSNNTCINNTTDQNWCEIEWDSDKLPTGDKTWGSFLKDYISKNLKDPNDENYTLLITECKGADEGNGIDISVDQPCEHPGESRLRGKSVEAANSTDDPEVKGGVNNILYTITGATCDGDHAVKSSNSRNVAVVYIMERAGRYCYNT